MAGTSGSFTLRDDVIALIAGFEAEHQDCQPPLRLTDASDESIVRRFSGRKDETTPPTSGSGDARSE